MKSVALLLLWIAATAAAIAVASAGVAVVDDEIIDPAPAVIASSASSIGSTPIAADPEGEIDEASREAPTGDSSGLDASTERDGSTGLDDSEGGLDPTAGSDDSESELDAASSSPTTTATSTAPASDSAPLGSPSSTTTTASPTPPVSTPATPAVTTTTNPPAPTSETLTFQLVGGTTAISFSPAGVDVLWASPNPGFDVKIEPEAAGLKVEFRSDTHRSRVDAWWDGGPNHEIREDPD